MNGRSRDIIAGCVGPLIGIAPAWGAETGTGGFSFIGSLLQMLAALAIVVGLILLMYHAANKWLPRLSPSGGVNRYIRVLETRYLAPKQSLVLVEVGGEYLLLGNSPAGVQLIKQIDMLEEIDVVEEPLARIWQHQSAERFRKVLAGMLQGREGGAATSRPATERRDHAA